MENVLPLLRVPMGITDEKTVETAHAWQNHFHFLLRSLLLIGFCEYVKLAQIQSLSKPFCRS